MVRMGPRMGPVMGPRRGPNASYGDGIFAIALPAHGLIAGDGPLTMTTTGALPTGLAAATPYYAIPIDAGHLNVAASYADALASTAIALTDAGTGVHTLVTGAAVTPTAYAHSEVCTPAFLDGWIAANSTTAPALHDGAGPVRFTTTNTLPGPLALATDYWLIATGADFDSYFPAASYADALALTKIVLLDDGVGVHTMTAQPTATDPVPVALADSPFTVVD